MMLRLRGVFCLERRLPLWALLGSLLLSLLVACDASTATPVLVRGPRPFGVGVGLFVLIVSLVAGVVACVVGYMNKRCWWVSQYYCFI